MPCHNNQTHTHAMQNKSKKKATSNKRSVKKEKTEPYRWFSADWSSDREEYPGHDEDRLKAV